MKKFCSYLIVMMMVLFFAFIGSTKTVYAEEKLKFKNFKYNTDKKLSGVYSEDIFSFNLDESVNAKEAYLNLICTQSDIIDKSNSSLTVLLNGNPVFSMKLDKIKNYKSNIKVKLPIENIVYGCNEVKISIYSRISDNIFNDDINSGNWFLIHGESFIHIDFEEKKTSFNINNFPNPFLKWDSESLKSIIMIPDKFKKSEVSAAMILASNFGSIKKYENISLKVCTESDEGKNNGDIIYIGRLDDSPKEILGFLNEYEIKELGETAVIKSGRSPYNENKSIMIIISNDDECLIKAVRLLANKDLLRQVNSSSYIVSKNMNVDSKGVKKEDIVTLKDFGYSSITLKGMLKQQANFSISNAKNKNISENAMIAVKCRYSKNIDFEKSIMTVYINDIPIGSKKLSLTLADNDIFEAAIPKEVRNMGYYEIRVVFDINVKDGYYTIKPEQTPWVYILNDSYLYLPYTNTKDLVFENYTNPFVVNNEFNKLTLVLSDNPNSEELSCAANIMAYLGHDILANTGKVNAVKSSEFNKDYYNDNLIVIGTPYSNKIIREMNKYFYIKYNNTFSSFVSNDKVKLLDGKSTASSIQLLDSPYSRENKVLALTSAYESDLILGSKYISDLNYVNKLKGNAVIVDGLGNIAYEYFGYKYKLNDNLKDIPLQKRIRLSLKTRYLIVFLTFTVSIIIIVFYVIIKKYKKNNLIWKKH